MQLASPELDELLVSASTNTTNNTSSITSGSTPCGTSRVSSRKGISLDDRILLSVKPGAQSRTFRGDEQGLNRCLTALAVIKLRPSQEREGE